MPTAFHPWSLRRLPAEPTFGLDEQLSLPVGHPEIPETATTKVTLLKRDYRPKVDQYECEHDFLTKLKYTGRAQGVRFNEYVSPYTFKLYIAREAKQPFPIGWVRTKDSVATDFIRRLNKNPAFSGIERVVDFDKLRPRLTIIKGAWFHEMRAANLSATGVFGTRVDQSDEFKRAELQGRISNLLVTYTFCGIDYLLTITQHGVIVTYDQFESEEHELDLVLDFKREVLDHCWSM